jgi:hypothetical protein
MFTDISEVTIDLPTPPLPLTTAITFLILLNECVSSKKLCGWLLQFPALAQLEQSELHPESQLDPQPCSTFSFSDIALPLSLYKFCF